MRFRAITPGAVLISLVVLAGGCGKSPTSPTVSATGDPAQVAATLAASATLVDETLAEDPTQVPANETFTGGSVRVEALVRPFTWWQHVTSETRTWDFAWADTDTTGRPTTCVATLHKHMAGTFVIIPVSPADSTQPDTSRIVKPLDKTLTRHVLLKRLPIGAGREWKVVSVTGAFVTTPGATVHIQSLRLQSSSGVDTTITDPLQWLTLRNVVKFAPDDSVTLTVTTNHTNDAVFIHRWDWRHRMRNNLDGTYTFTWATSAWSGWRHFGVQAMTHGSLYDDTLPYDAEAWHLPFRVAGGQPDVDYYT
jgi:hypothetical protein